MNEGSSFIGRTLTTGLSALLILAIAGIIALDVATSIQDPGVGSDQVGPPPLPPAPGVPNGCTLMSNDLLVCDIPVGP